MSLRPVIRTLTDPECEAILARNHVGRLAFVGERGVDMEPLHYVYRDGWLYGRTSAGAKLDATGPRWAPVAFEVDEVEEIFRWRSVVVRGGFFPLSPGGAEWERSRHLHGVELLRELVPGTLGEDDPFPERDVVFRISAQEMTGRECVPGDEL